MGVVPKHFSTSRSFQFNATLKTTNSRLRRGSIVTAFNGTGSSTLKSSLVCATTSLGGLGVLTDHGFRDHGWNDHYELNLPPHNLGRSANFEAFSQFMVRNLMDRTSASTTTEQKEGFSPFNKPVRPTIQKIRINFSILSSRDKDRRLEFTQHVKYLNNHLPEQFFDVQYHALWNMTLGQQVELAQSSHVFITACGGGSMTATFLPRGASLIVFYNPTGGVDFNTLESLPNQSARLDWDLLNNAGHLRVHWFPILYKPTQEQENDDLELLHQLILHEAQLILNANS